VYVLEWVESGLFLSERPVPTRGQSILSRQNRPILSVVHRNRSKLPGLLERFVFQRDAKRPESTDSFIAERMGRIS
jgi:hypothetical protein